MVELNQTVPRTHVLKDILALLLPHYAFLASIRRGLTFLTRFAVETRYPGDSATKRQAMAALRWSGKVRDTCRGILGVGPHRSGP
jgi:HEPN domain-containing protein